MYYRSLKIISLGHWMIPNENSPSLDMLINKRADFTIFIFVATYVHISYIRPDDIFK